ncbi:hypothetical protein EC604_28920 [Paenibacillus amylolyticus]|uniref:Uncharacterized protein n=1 Tax=Paenibacillus amylolyticus TaxID=1451 RepID=A0A5M9X227_PAEAM|nr:hypothetical protein [Paenibacillus amylolyticus]KAA8787849.1 hypothetical protein EC604_28920 [Paenibacillus amylolyticus]
MGRKQSTGVSTNTVMRASTTKQRADQLHRYKDNRERRLAERRRANTVYGALTYGCSNCANTIRVQEEMGDRKILCSKCNQGFFTQLKKDDRNNLARPEDFKTKGKSRSTKKR